VSYAASADKEPRWIFFKIAATLTMIRVQCVFQLMVILLVLICRCLFMPKITNRMKIIIVVVRRLFYLLFVFLLLTLGFDGLVALGDRLQPLQFVVITLRQLQVPKFTADSTI
jgi:hypothetical protein